MKCWKKYISGQTECSVLPCALFAFCVQVQDLHIIVLPFSLMINSEQNGSKNIVKGLNMKVLKKHRCWGIKLKFQWPIYIHTAMFLPLYLSEKKTTKNGCGFVVDGGGDAGECWHQRQPAGPHWPDPAMFGFVKQCWMYVLLRSYMSACDVSLSVCLCVFVCCVAFSSLQFFKHGFFFQRVHWVYIFWTFDWHFLMY